MIKINNKKITLVTKSAKIEEVSTLQNQLILFNPYYQADVIEQHLQVLLETGTVAFGKIRSDLKNVEHQFQEEIHKVYENVDEKNYMQLFLTDYSNIYVAKVIKVTSFDKSSIAPSYYKKKKLDIEKWFVISDMREIVRNDFEAVRDGILSNFTTPNYSDRSYAIYGNNYIYPLMIDQKTPENFFESENSDFRYYTNMFKSKEYLDIKNNMIQYTFGDKWINFLHPNSLDNIISAEIEYQQNINDPLYDYTSVVIKYSKTMEKEIHIFIIKLFGFLISKDDDLQYITYSVQNRDFELKDIFTNKPNLGTFKFLLQNHKIKDSIENNIKDFHIKRFIKSTISFYISKLQAIRNESVHGEAPSYQDVYDLRKDILGLSKESMIAQLVKHRVKIYDLL